MTKQVVIEDVRDMLLDGVKRREICKHYGVPYVAMKPVFDHPLIKGMRVRKKNDLKIVVVSREDANNDVEQDNTVVENSDTAIAEDTVVVENSQNSEEPGNLEESQSFSDDFVESAFEN